MGPYPFNVDVKQCADSLRRTAQIIAGFTRKLAAGPDPKPHLSTQTPGLKSGGPFRVWRYRDRLHHRHDLNIAIDGWSPK